MTLRPGEVVLIRIDFHQTPGGKLRPAVVLLDSADDDFVAAPITSRQRVSDFDVPFANGERPDRARGGSAPRVFAGSVGNGGTGRSR
jgi:mRNA-degrading endonuclease toxin of MazEF toxin-antitoxin module